MFFHDFEIRFNESPPPSSQSSMEYFRFTMRIWFLSFVSCLCSILCFAKEDGTHVDPQYAACSRPASCGKGPDISYPFSINTQPSYCGYRGFNLICQNHQPVLQTARDNYIVLNIFHENQSLLVVNQNWKERICKPNFNIFRFSYLSSFIILPGQPYLLLNCTDQSRVNYHRRRIDCRTQNRTLFVYDENGFPDFAGESDLCNSTNASVPVLEEAAVNGNFSNPWELLDKGFVLQWNGINCTSCSRSGGFCGFDDKSQQICFCPDRPHRVRCNSDHSKGYSKIDGNQKIIIGVSVSAVVIVAIILSLFILWCNRTNRYVTALCILLCSSITQDDESKSKSFNYPTHVFTYRELQEATNDFDSSRELGDGGFGTVYYGKLKDGRSVAVKRLFDHSTKRVEQFMNEVHVLSSLRHQNLVSLYGCTSRHSQELLLVYEFILNGTVADHLHGDRAEQGKLTWAIRRSIAVETAEALAYLHAVDPPIIHRDVKTDNILLDNNLRVKVADFGLCRLFPMDATHVSTTPQGTPGYLDPDYHKCYQLTVKSDVYSFGVVLAELISSKPAVDIARHRHEINLATMATNMIQSRNLNQLVDPVLGFGSDLKVQEEITRMAELALLCLQEEKDARPNMEEVVKKLQRIERGENWEESDSLGEDVGLLKKIPPPSPDTVIDSWMMSKSTNSSTSS